MGQNNRPNKTCRPKAPYKTPQETSDAIVLDQLRSSTGSIETRQVIDGQQRLTTLQILLAALRDTCGALGIQKFPARFGKLTSNKLEHVGLPVVASQWYQDR